MFRALILIVATMLVAEVSPDSEFDGLFDEPAVRQEQDPSREALRRMFDKYGERDSGRMTFEGFEHLLESLGLGHIVIVDHDVHDHHSDDGQFYSLHEDHVHNDEHQQSNHPEEHARVDSDHPHDHQRRHKRSTDVSIDQQSAANGTDISQVCIVVNDSEAAKVNKNSNA